MEAECLTNLQNKKWWKQIVKSNRIKKSYRTYCFPFTQISDKNLQLPWKTGDFQHLSRAYSSCFMHATVACMKLSFLQNILIFCTILLKFSNILPFFYLFFFFLPFFWKIICMVLLSRIGPVITFHSIRKAPQMQIFVFLHPRWHQEQSGLSDSRTFQPQGG